MSLRKLIGGITLATVAAHSAIRFGTLGTHKIHLVDDLNYARLSDEDKCLHAIAKDDSTANYLSVKHHRNIFYDKLSYWRDGAKCLPVTVRTYKPMIVTHTNLDGKVTVLQSTFGL